uniref:Uncharacterized protein n=1 Tax=Arundo donax TaxID=35708 RepID=A0A0A9BLA7_ARUDO
MDAATEAARDAISRGLRWDSPALSELVALLHAGGHVARARELLLEILRDGCAAQLDTPAFDQIIGRTLCDDGEGRCVAPARVVDQAAAR